MIVRPTVFIARITLILSGGVAAIACSSEPDASPPDAAGGAAQGGGGSAVGGNPGNGGAGVQEGGVSEGSAGGSAGGGAGAGGGAVEGGSAGSGGDAVEGGAIEGGALDAEASTPIPDHCGGFGASQVGCPCATEGQYYCYQAGDGLDCMGGVWTHLIDGPCWPTDASNCTDQVAGCKCPLLRQRICVNGQGLQCFGDGRWHPDPTACGDSSTGPD